MIKYQHKKKCILRFAGICEIKLCLERGSAFETDWVLLMS